MAVRGPEWAAWVDRLPALVRGLIDDWQLIGDGAPRHGYVALVLPVRTAGGQPAVLKISFPDEEVLPEHLALQRWAGRGAVRMLRADPHRCALLLERLSTEDLTSTWDLEACEIVGGIYARLHVSAGPQFPLLTDYVARWGEQLAELPRSAPLPRRLVEQAISSSRELVADPASVGTLIHGDLHYENVLAGAREPWLAIDPQPKSGDPHYEPAPMLWNRFEELAGDVRAGVRRRFHTLVDIAELEEERARDWVVVRMLNNACWLLGDPPAMRSPETDRAWLTMCVAIAKAVQD